MKIEAFLESAEEARKQSIDQPEQAEAMLEGLQNVATAINENLAFCNNEPAIEEGVKLASSYLHHDFTHWPAMKNWIILRHDNSMDTAPIDSSVPSVKRFGADTSTIGTSGSSGTRARVDSVGNSADNRAAQHLSDMKDKRGRLVTLVHEYGLLTDKNPTLGVPRFFRGPRQGQPIPKTELCGMLDDIKKGLIDNGVETGLIADAKKLLETLDNECVPIDEAEEGASAEAPGEIAPPVLPRGSWADSSATAFDIPVPGADAEAAQEDDGFEEDLAMFRGELPSG